MKFLLILQKFKNLKVFNALPILNLFNWFKLLNKMRNNKMKKLEIAAKL